MVSQQICLVIELVHLIDTASLYRDVQGQDVKTRAGWSNRRGPCLVWKREYQCRTVRRNAHDRVHMAARMAIDFPVQTTFGPTSITVVDRCVQNHNVADDLCITERGS